MSVQHDQRVIGLGFAVSIARDCVWQGCSEQLATVGAAVAQQLDLLVPQNAAVVVRNSSDAADSSSVSSHTVALDADDVDNSSVHTGSSNSSTKQSKKKSCKQYVYLQESKNTHKKAQFAGSVCRLSLPTAQLFQHSICQQLCATVNFFVCSVSPNRQPESTSASFGTDSHRSQHSAQCDCLTVTQRAVTGRSVTRGRVTRRTSAGSQLGACALQQWRCFHASDSYAESVWQPLGIVRWAVLLYCSV
eukprot:9067-Heterococcus_DN1.PRE.1